VLEQFKQSEVVGYIPDEYLEKVKGLYLLLARQGRLNVRYLKLPMSWLRIGLFGGILEELIVILRTPSQTGMGTQHMFTVEEVMLGIKTFNAKHSEESDDVRFLFLTNLSEKPKDVVKNTISEAITYQGASKRIGIYYDSSSEVSTTLVYAIQGIYGGVKYDPRVVTNVTPKFFAEGANRFAVHFTRENIALAIFNKVSVKAPRSREVPIEIGSICKFDRAIHALTCVTIGADLVCLINEDKVGIRTRMVHGIDDTKKRPKYEAGLVIDMLKLSEMLPKGNVQINEIGTLLVHSDIPHACIVDCLHTEKQLNNFWRREAAPPLDPRLFGLCPNGKTTPDH
jgi:hypothetical protein